MTKQALHNKAKLYMVLHGDRRVWGCWHYKIAAICEKKHKKCFMTDAIVNDDPRKIKLFKDKYFYQGKDTINGQKYESCIRWLED